MPRRSQIADHPGAAEMIALRESGRSIASIASEFGVPEESLKRYLRKTLASVAIGRNGSPLSGPEGPVEVFREASGHEPMPHQVIYLEGRLPTVVRKGRQVGMTEAASSLAIWTARSRPGADAVVISPSMRQSSEVTMRARIGLDRLGDKLVQDSASLIRLSNGSRIVSLPGTSRSVRGYAPMLVVVDEAAWVGEDTWTAARPLVSASGGRMIVQSTPGEPWGWFFDLAMTVPDGWAEIVVRSVDVPTIDPEFLARERAEMPPHLFAQEYEGTFMSSAVSRGLWFPPDEFDERVDPRFQAIKIPPLGG